ncbi:PGG domain-containing protein [Heracleum sosnowskyi]|uniref:PGG domain-containing protein n=1 Tax=Heracleum sosnowskyi TaxID=360622 RepID=A0AAD8IZV8_9APIA|nr:PGG domain-containing protein [Heracleum sosnowskyi]
MSGEDIYAALTQKDEAKVRELCWEHPDGPFHKLTRRRDSVLQKALYSTQVDLVLVLLSDAKKRWQRDFYKKMGEHVNKTDNNILHVAATHDSCIRAAKKIVKYAPHLLTLENNRGERPIFIAARYGQFKMFKFLNRQLINLVPDVEDRLSFYQLYNKRGESYTILHQAIHSEHFELALYIAREIPTLICEENEKRMTALHLLAMNPSAFRNQDWKWLKRLLPSSFRSLSVEILHKDATEDENVEGAAGKIGSSSTITIPWWDEIKKEYRRSEAALQLGSILVKEDKSWIEPISATDSEENAGSTSAANSSNEPVKPPTPLILATKYGCSDIALMIINTHPQTVEQVGPKHGSILHLAIKYQRIEIFDAVMDMEMQMRKLVRLHDLEGNTILHMVALNTRKVEFKNGTEATSSHKPKAKSFNPWDAEEIKDETRSPAFELQDDLLLFKRVERILKTHYHKTLNKNLKTADQLFAAKKEPLRDSAQEWMKRTAENCSIIAVLIATVAFAAAYTVPGGTDDKNGSPLLLKETFFVVFTIADVLSLASTLTAVVVFLSILTSSYRFHDFKETLPKSLMIGISCLVFSLTMMMLAFAATIILMIKNKQQWTKIALYAVAFLPVTVLVATYLPFYVPLMRTFHYTTDKLKNLLPKFNHPNKSKTLPRSHVRKPKKLHL